MGYTPIFIAKKQGKKMELLDKKRFYEVLETLKDGLIEVVIRERKEKRSERIHRYLFGAYYPLIEEETGQDKKTIHECFKHRYLFVEEVELYGFKVSVCKSSTQLTNKEFCDFIKRIEVDTGIPAPDTDEFKKFSK